ncbi:MAG: 30S ribosomal protein S4 [Gammaproteobacteria bacterium]
MARYTGASCKLARRAKYDLDLKTRPIADKCNFERLPGQHGQTHTSVSAHGKAFREKQKVKRIYGVLEKQFRNYYLKSKRIKGATGEILLQLLERRLDNVVYRMGFGRTRPESRQLVTHGGVVVNGKAVNIPSYQLAPGDIVEVKEASKTQARVQEALQLAAQRTAISWIEVDAKQVQGKFISVPERSDLPAEYNENLIVELYSK